MNLVLDHQRSLYFCSLTSMSWINVEIPTRPCLSTGLNAINSYKDYMNERKGVKAQWLTYRHREDSIQKNAWHTLGPLLCALCTTIPAPISTMTIFKPPDAPSERLMHLSASNMTRISSAGKTQFICSGTPTQLHKLDFCHLSLFLSPTCLS